MIKLAFYYIRPTFDNITYSDKILKHMCLKISEHLIYNQILKYSQLVDVWDK